MKSCLVPPNLRKAGDNALAKVLTFGELTKKPKGSFSVAVETFPLDKLAEKKGHRRS